MSKGQGPGQFHSHRQIAEAYKIVRARKEELVEENTALKAENQSIRENKLLIRTQEQLAEANREIERLREIERIRVEALRAPVIEPAPAQVEETVKS